MATVNGVNSVEESTCLFLWPPAVALPAEPFIHTAGSAPFLSSLSGTSEFIVHTSCSHKRAAWGEPPPLLGCCTALLTRISSHIAFGAELGRKPHPSPAAALWLQPPAQGSFGLAGGAHPSLGWGQHHTALEPGELLVAHWLWEFIPPGISQP